MTATFWEGVGCILFAVTIYVYAHLRVRNIVTWPRFA